MSTKIAKIKRIAVVLKIFFLIGEIASIAGLFASFIILALFGLAHFPASNSHEILANFNNIGYGSTDSLVAALITFAFTCILMTLTFHFSRRLFKQISQAESPFLKENVSALRTVARFTLMLGILPPFLLGLLSLIFGAANSIVFNASSIYFAILVYGISIIFDYGYQLQVEVDETL